MDLTTIIFCTILGVGVVLGALAIFSTSTGEGIPRYPKPPRVPELPYYRLLVSELQEGELYYCVLSDRLVKVRSTQSHTGDVRLGLAIGYCFNKITGNYDELHFRDNDLYTENINLAPRAKADKQRRHDELMKEVLGKEYTYTGTYDL